MEILRQSSSNHLEVVCFGNDGGQERGCGSPFLVTENDIFPMRVGYISHVETMPFACCPVCKTAIYNSKFEDMRHLGNKPSTLERGNKPIYQYPG